MDRSQQDTKVSWVIFKRREKKMNYVAIKSAPFVISEELKRYLFDTKDTVILTSATISVAGDFSFFKNTIGLAEKVVEGVIGSPFDYKNNCCFYIAPMSPDDDDFFEKALKVIKHSIEISKGRAFCLFTSYKMMAETYKALNGNIGYDIIRQGDMSRFALISEFMNTDNKVLFGTSSFWEGVSVEGKRLSAVIIDRVPFPVPSNPVMRARIDKAKRDLGKRWFTDFYLPMAIIKLKQGFGRLIRTKSDSGFVVLLDGRIEQKNYGPKILKALPPARRVKSLKEIDTVK